MRTLDRKRIYMQPAGRLVTPGPNGIVVGSLVGLAGATAGVNPLISSVGVRPWHIFLVAALVYVLMSTPSQRIYHYRLLSVEWCMGLFVLSSVFAEIVNGEDLNYSADLISAVSALFYFIGYVVIRITIRDLTSAMKVLGGLIWPAIPVCLLAVLQTLSVGVFPELTLSIANSDGGQARLDSGSLIRATSLIGHWTGLGAYLCGIIAAALCLRVLQQRINYHSSLTPFVIVTSVIGTVCTLTISVIITAFLIVLVSWRAAGFRTKAAVTSAALAVMISSVFGYFISFRIQQQALPNTAEFADLPAWLPNTLVHRLNVWYSETWPSVVERPLTGWGNGAYGFGDASRTYSSWLQWSSAESQWFWLLMTYGTLSAVFFLFLLTFALGRVWRARQAVVNGSWVTPVLVLFAMSLVTSLTVPVFTNRGLPVVLWALIAVVIAYFEAFEESSDDSVYPAIKVS